ncbi:MAG: hypothetical protein O3C28_11810 [Proteobacteria bacterium]|nr:hypothetical protein [Pseudomonadota bacterium]
MVEESGIATVCLSTGRDLTVQVRPPRSAFVNFPMGNAFGKPFDVEMQTQILRHCLAIAVNCDTPGEIIDLPYNWHGPFEFNPGNSNM